jgi:hypothetical protein
MVPSRVICIKSTRLEKTPRGHTLQLHDCMQWERRVVSALSPSKESSAVAAVAVPPTDGQDHVLIYVLFPTPDCAAQTVRSLQDEMNPMVVATGVSEAEFEEARRQRQLSSTNEITQPSDTRTTAAVAKQAISVADEILGQVAQQLGGQRGGGTRSREPRGELQKLGLSLVAAIPTPAARPRNPSTPPPLPTGSQTPNPEASTASLYCFAPWGSSHYVQRLPLCQRLLCAVRARRRWWLAASFRTNVARLQCAPARHGSHHPRRRRYQARCPPR